MEVNNIIVSDIDNGQLKYFTIKAAAVFQCPNCGKAWSSHMATIKVDLYACKICKKYKQTCKSCNDWIPPKFTEYRFKEAIDRVVTKYWERKRQYDDDDTAVEYEDKRYLHPRAQPPHNELVCERCMELGRPCW